MAFGNKQQAEGRFRVAPDAATEVVGERASSVGVYVFSAAVFVAACAVVLAAGAVVAGAVTLPVIIAAAVVGLLALASCHIAQ